jgi:hypothetical protein
MTFWPPRSTGVIQTKADLRSIPCSRIRGLTPVGEWLSLVEHLVRDQGVGGSNPLSPTNL